MSEIKKRLNENNVQKIFKSVVKDQPISYQYGPLNKSQETQIFEEIIHDIIKDYQDSTRNITFSKQNGQILLNRKGELINLKNLLDNINFNHLSFSKEDIAKYAANKKLYVSPLSYQEFQKKIKEADVQQEVSLSALDYGEMLAINKYTGPYYKTMSLLLRDTNSMQTNQVASTMLHIAMASHGLNKLPDMDLPQVIRSQDEYNINQLIKNAKEHTVSQEKSFISTSLSSSVKIDTESNNKNVRIIYKNVRGKSISAISQRPDEFEYLLPPSTQIRWIGYTKTGAGHVLTAEGANVLINESSLPTFKASEEIIHAAANLEHKVDSQISRSANPVVDKAVVISDQLPSEQLVQHISSLPLNKIFLTQETSNKVKKNLKDKSKVVIEVFGKQLTEKAQRFISKETPSSTLKPPIPSKSMNSLNLHHQIPILDTNTNDDTKLMKDSTGKVKQALEQFGKEIVDISIKHNLITQQHKDKYFEVDSAKKESKFSNDIKETVKENTSLKNTLQNLVKKISKSLGLAAIYFYLEKTISNKSKFNDHITKIRSDLKTKQNNTKSIVHKKSPLAQKLSTQWYL